MSIPCQCAKGIVLVSGLFLYFAFRETRAFLPSGIFNDSFPSLVFMPVALPLVDFVHSLISRTPSRWSHNFWTVACAALLASILIEVAAPLLSFQAVSDAADAVAIFIGGFSYWCLIHMLESKTNQAGARGVDPDTGDALDSCFHETDEG